MAFNSQERLIKSAVKIHKCGWCGDRIKIGESYIRYRFYDCGDAGTVKLHQECSRASYLLASQENETIYFNPGDNEKGHFCGGVPECGCIEQTRINHDFTPTL